MKKNTILILLIVLMVALVGTLVGCKDKEEDQGEGKIPLGFTAKDFFNASAAVTSTNVSINVSNDGEVIYTYSNGKETTKYEGFKFDGSFATEVTNMQYSEDNLSDIVITENTLQSQAELRAGIKDVNALFGIESQIENAQIIMAIDSTAKTFKYLEINYTLVDDVTTYDTTIIVTVA